MAQARRHGCNPKATVHGIVDVSPVLLLPPSAVELALGKPKEAAMAYVDGFVIAVPKDRLEDYERMAKLGCALWMELGAVSYVESVGDDVPYGELTSFPRAVQAKDDEVVVFSWITYKSREDRDAIVAKVMTDPRMKEFENNMPFDGKRMIYGGFKTIVSA
jgi:uncharacterized protein YbaA (DUF1428 family)